MADEKNPRRPEVLDQVLTDLDAIAHHALERERAVAVQQASLYYHIKNKEELLHGICYSSFLQVVQTVEAAARSAPTGPGVPTDPNIHEVTSPLLGTFYRSPKPGAPPYVEVGSQVEEGTVVAIIEVMKLMNTVRAGVRGTVTEIALADGSLAEYGQTLLRVRKAVG